MPPNVKSTHWSFWSRGLYNPTLGTIHLSLNLKPTVLHVCFPVTQYIPHIETRNLKSHKLYRTETVEFLQYNSVHPKMTKHLSKIEESSEIQNSVEYKTGTVRRHQIHSWNVEQENVFPFRRVWPGISSTPGIVLSCGEFFGEVSGVHRNITCGTKIRLRNWHRDQNEVYTLEEPLKSSVTPYISWITRPSRFRS